MAYDVKYIITVDEKGATKQIQTFDQAVNDLGKSAGGAGSHFSGLWKQFAIGQIAVGALHKGWSLFKNELLSTVSAAAAQEQADRNLAAALDITGRTIPLAAMKEFAGSLQKATKYGDEQIMSVQTLLVQMTKLDKEGIERATRGTLGLASALGMDLNAAALLVQKAMSGQFATLSRYGIVLDETLTNEEKQAQLLGILEKMYKRAEAEVDTYSGRVAQLKGFYGDLKEELGKAFTENERVRDLIVDVKDRIIELIESGKLDEWADRAAKGITAIIDGMQGFINVTTGLLSGAGPFQKFSWQVTGMGNEVAEARRKILDFGGTLKNVKQNTEEAARHLQKGEAAWASYKQRVKELDDQLGRERKLPKLASPEATAEIYDLEAAMKSLGVKTVPQLEKELAAAEKALAAFRASGQAAPGVLAELEKKAGELRTALYGVGGAASSAENDFIAFTRQVQAAHNAAKALTAVPFKLFGDYGPEQAVYELTKLPPAINRTELAMRSLELASQNTGQRIKQSVGDWAREFQAKLEAVKQYTSLAFGSMNAVIAQAQTNRQIELENEYKLRLDIINKSVMAEEEKQRAIEALEADYQIKQSSAKRAAAKQSKAIALMEAIVNTADAVTKALTAGPIVGPILAGIIGAMGAMQISLITKQPIPLAKGAYFKEPTLLPAMGQTYALAEAGAARSGEIVSPVAIMRQIVRDEIRGAGVTIELGSGAIQVFAQTLDDRAIESIGPKLGRVLNDQLRIHGRSPLWQT